MKTFNLYTNRLAMLCAAILILTATSCKKNNNNMPDMVDDSITGPDIALFALSADNKLLSLNAKNPSSSTSINITGLQTGETILGIDFRPATGQLYGIGSSSYLYVINTSTGAARVVGSAALSPVINGTALGFDFNPTVDRIRLVTSTGQNLRLHPELGTVAATDGAINGATSPNVTAAAYTNNRSGATATVLFVIDVANDKLYKQDPPNDGKLVEVGSIGFDVEQAGGFDISPAGVAIATLKKGGVTNLYTIDLTTGKATKIKNELTGNIIGLAIPTEPVAYAISSTNELVIFNPANPSPVNKAITGLAASENILGIDFRPATNQLYALGSTSRIYLLNIGTGAATAVGTAPFTTLLAGTDFGFDFNPMADRLRIVSNTGQNLRVNPNDGLLAATDTNLSPGTPSITGAAYTNNFAGATSTVLFDIDTQTGRLLKQDPSPNGGVLADVGTLGVTATASNGFDIGSTSGIAYALLTVSGVTKVYTINLTTGAATAGATLAGNVKGFTVGLGF